MKKTIVLIAFLSVGFFFSSFNDGKYSISSQPHTKGSLTDIAKAFLLAEEQSYQQSATRENVEAVLSFCCDTVKYDHVLSPDKKFSFSGKNQWRTGSVSHLGETKNVKLEIVQCIHQQNIVVVEFTLYREVTDGGQKSKGTILSIIEFNKDSKIDKLTDYL